MEKIKEALVSIKRKVEYLERHIEAVEWEDRITDVLAIELTIKEIEENTEELYELAYPEEEE